MRYGKGRGCDFLTSDCVINGKVKYKNEFFEEDSNWKPSCSSGRQSRTFSILYMGKDVPDYYQFFTRKDYIGWESADYCPVNTENPKESKNSYFSGNCKFGFTYYGSFVFNKVESNEDSITNFLSTIGDKYGENSFCSLSSLTLENNPDSTKFKDIVHSVCYPMFCSSRSLTIQINEQYKVCPRSGGKVKVEGFEGYLLCPDYNLICTGTVLCNNMFDCVDKKSLIKEETYIYDYEIRTNQNIFESEHEPFIEGFEESDDGKCPKNCSQCDSNFMCKIYIN